MVTVCAYTPELWPGLPRTRRRYGNIIAASVNRKGVMDVDTVKGCTYGMRAYPDGGCYGECYAKKIADRSGIDFAVAVPRVLADAWQHRDVLIKQLLDHDASWYRVGVMGDPCHAWAHTVRICKALIPAGKVPVIVTKHWVTMTDHEVSWLRELGAVVHTSMSGMDTDAEVRHRVAQMDRLRAGGVASIARIVTCAFGDTAWGRECADRQSYLASLGEYIDTPFRVPRSNPRVLTGDILVTSCPHSIGGGKTVSLFSATAYLGTCGDCPDQCGVSNNAAQLREEVAHNMNPVQVPLINPAVEFVKVDSVIGSGYEEAVAKLALEDGIAHRAARKNMQRHPAIILLIDGAFAGFFTFEVNDEAGEFCMLQSVIEPVYYTDELYMRMAQEVIDCNDSGLPIHMTTNPKSKFETPAVFESLGFVTYMQMNGFHYMIKGDPSQFRMKLLAHIAMTNVWDSVKGDWLRVKKEWNEQIKLAGARHDIPNPLLATREGCWQGESGFANVVTGRSHNLNASVLDPVVCEQVVRFCMPRDGTRLYNPFGGGVQMGFVAASCGHEYVASEIRQNQCDANNALCSDLRGTATWVRADSSTYEPDGMFDLVFSCPPYYRVERYVDYDGEPPEGEINALPTYAEFRDALFAGYRIAVDHLNEGCFFVVMVGDSRAGKDGGYLGADAETELFMRDSGLLVFNKIIYLEAEFTRLAQAKKTLHYRKWPKREQRILMAYKGDPKTIRDRFSSIGRL